MVRKCTLTPKGSAHPPGGLGYLRSGRALARDRVYYVPSAFDPFGVADPDSRLTGKSAIEPWRAGGTIRHVGSKHGATRRIWHSLDSSF